MELIRGLHNLQPRHRGCVLSIGNFDGVHLGHRAILARLGELAGLHALPPLVLLFEPQPSEFFAPDKAPARLTPLREKLEHLHALHLERILCLPFHARLAAMAAETFITDVLVARLGVRALVVGDDFRFGHGRAGDSTMLREFGGRLGFTVESHPTHLVDGARVSSSRIRACLAAGDLAGAARLLGRPYTLGGRVAQGRRLAREWGFPTLNVRLKKPPPISGIFTGRVAGIAPQTLPAVVYVGYRPVFGDPRPVLEAHLLDFTTDGEAYGARIRVDLLEKIRDDAHFSSLDALRAQIALDAETARRRLGVPATPAPTEDLPIP
jgi:riboflavin kinase/FMN adenylyltransferase